MPRLIGMWRLPFPRVRQVDGHLTEMIRDVATDETGQHWGLVVRKTPLGPSTARLDPVRWVRWDATPFAYGETVTVNSWDVANDPGDK